MSYVYNPIKAPAENNRLLLADQAESGATAAAYQWPATAEEVVARALANANQMIQDAGSDGSGDGPVEVSGGSSVVAEKNKTYNTVGGVGDAQFTDPATASMGDTYSVNVLLSAASFDSGAIVVPPSAIPEEDPTPVQLVKVVRLYTAFGWRTLTTAP